MTPPPPINAPSTGWEWAAGQTLEWDDGECQERGGSRNGGSPTGVSPDGGGSLFVEPDGFPGTPDGLSDQALEALFRAQWGLPSPDAGDEPPVRERVLIRDGNQDEDDYTEEEWEMVKVLRTLCKQATHLHSPKTRRTRAVEWLFVNGTEEPKHHWTFHLLCQALRARPWVIQTMVQHVWFRRVIVPDPLPFLADPMPEALQSEAILCAWGAGETILALVWGQPGAVLSRVRQQSMMSEGTFDRTVETLLREGLLGQCVGRVWVSSRPAHFIRPGQRVSWSRSFAGD